MTTIIKKTRSAKKTKAANDAEIRVRIDAKTKSKAERLFKRYGMSTSDGVRLLIDHAIRDKALPRDPDAPHAPNAETMKVIEEAAAGKNLEIVTIEDIKKQWDDA